MSEYGVINMFHMFYVYVIQEYVNVIGVLCIALHAGDIHKATQSTTGINLRMLL